MFSFLFCIKGKTKKHNKNYKLPIYENMKFNFREQQKHLNVKKWQIKYNQK